MSPNPTRRPWQRCLPHVVAGLLVAWALGLGMATLRLQSWQQELSTVLIQLRADELLRSSVHARDQVHPQWYRQRALALLSAVERLRDDSSWTLVMPGSWRAFDDLEEQAARRIDQAFNQIVVETIRQEIDARAASLSGTNKPTGEGPCLPPMAHGEPAVSAGGPRAVPDYDGMMRHLLKVRQLDQAIGALVALSQPETARPEHMRMLVRYSLNAELSGTASRSLSLFNAHAPLPRAQLETMVENVQQAVQCSVFKGMEAIHARWFDQHALLVIEDQLARMKPAILFEPASAAGLAASTARLRATRDLLEHQARALAGGSHQWMRSAEPRLGSAYEQLLRRVSEIRLLGPGMAAQLRAQAQARHTQFRRRFDAHFSRPDAGIAWHARTGRFSLSADRAALREGLARLLESPLLKAPPSPGAPRLANLKDAADSRQPLDALVDLVHQRRQFTRETLGLFPQAWRGQAAAYVDDLVTARAVEQAHRYVTQTTADSWRSSSLLILAYERTDQVASTLLEAGSPALATRIRAYLEDKVIHPMAAFYVQPTAPASPALAE